MVDIGVGTKVPPPSSPFLDGVHCDEARFVCVHAVRKM